MHEGDADYEYLLSIAGVFKVEDFFGGGGLGINERT